MIIAVGLSAISGGPRISVVCWGNTIESGARDGCFRFRQVSGGRKFFTFFVKTIHFCALWIRNTVYYTVYTIYIVLSTMTYAGYLMVIYMGIYLVRGQCIPAILLWAAT